MALTGSLSSTPTTVLRSFCLKTNVINLIIYLKDGDREVFHQRLKIFFFLGIVMETLHIGM